jgi:hypothetical protein
MFQKLVGLAAVIHRPCYEQDLQLRYWPDYGQRNPPGHGPRNLLGRRPLGYKLGIGLRCATDQPHCYSTASTSGRLRRSDNADIHNGHQPSSSPFRHRRGRARQARHVTHRGQPPPIPRQHSRPAPCALPTASLDSAIRFSNSGEGDSAPTTA